MDNEKIILTIQVLNENNNAFKFSSTEDITYDQLKQKTIEEFKVSEDDIKYMSFYYKDNEGLFNYINKDDSLGKLAEIITPGYLLLKLNFEINLYGSRKSRVSNFSIIDNKKSIPNMKEILENEQKKLDDEKNNSKKNQLDRIIKAKDDEIWKLNKVIEKLINPNIVTKNNYQVFHQEKENENLELKNIIKKIEKEFIDNIKNKFDSIINEKLKYLDELMSKIVKTQKLFESKIENVQEFPLLNIKIFEELIDKKSKEIANKTNENINNQLKQIEKSMTNKIEKLYEEKEFNSNNKNDNNINRNNMNKNENKMNDNKNINNDDENNINDNENIINDNNYIIDDNENNMNINNIINTNEYNNFNKNNKIENNQNILEQDIGRISSLCYSSKNVRISGYLDSDFIEINKFDDILTKEELNNFLNNFFFVKTINVSKTEISKENINKFLKIDSKLKDEENLDINNYLNTYLNQKLDDFKNSHCNYNENDIRKKFEKRRKNIIEKLIKAKDSNKSNISKSEVII